MKSSKTRSDTILDVFHLIRCVILAGKRRRDINSEDEANRAAKRARQQSISEASTKQVDINRWLNTSCPSLPPSIAETTQLLKTSDTMPRKPSVALPSPDDSFERTITSSRRSERTTASVHDSDYRQSLRQRNVYIDREDPPQELMRRAHRIISRSRASPEADDLAIQELKDRSRRLQEDAEEEIVQQLAPGIIPAMNRLPDQRLARNADQSWSNAVPLSLKPSVLTYPLPLPKPKPDLAFGYSQNAFTENQLGTIELLVDDQFGRSFAVPDQKLRFPFLDIEFKSQAKGGTHYIATNQAAGAGAIALSGEMELMQRSISSETIDYNEPKFFSITMDHEIARINVHWLKASREGANYSFHVEGLSQHLLKDADGVRAIIRAIKNILDHGADKRLRTLCTALDAYREMVVRDREAANPRRLRHEALPKVDDGQGRRGNDLTLGQTIAKNLRHTSMPRAKSVEELVTEQRTTKRERHGTGATRILGTSEAPMSSSRQITGTAGKSTYSVAPTLGSRSRHKNAGGVAEPKRRTKPSEKLKESRESTFGHHGAKPRGRHDP